MASKIRVLDDLTVNKIAAGEVIENPASVVKELLENSLDAAASEIVIEVQGGGRLLIKVSDNGSGMDRDDALLCLERHATSKLKSIDDLFTLSSMGFRGEALPSIASVSQFSLLTSIKSGTLIKVEGGKLLFCDKAERAQGTTIEVRDLFYNVPARKKFQKSVSSDEMEIVKAVHLEAIARPDIKFQLIINQKSTLLALPSDLKTRLNITVGPSFTKELLPLEKKEGDFHISGFIGKPFSYRHNRSGQYLVINKRPVSSPLISHFIREAYSTHLPQGKHPIFCLQINLPPDFIDVNVHPQKREIRLREENHLKRLLFLAVQESLGKERTPDPIDWTPEALHALPWDMSYKPLTFSEPLPSPSLPLEEKKMLPHVLATIKGYILVSSADKEGLIFIDQARAHARILFEKLEKDTSLSCEKQALLLPLTIELSKTDCLVLQEHLLKFQALGFDIREFGPYTFAIEAFPLFFSESSLIPLIHNFLAEIKEHKSSSLKEQSLKNKLAEKSASLCMSTEKCLSLEEARYLIKELHNCGNPHESPQGKPIQVSVNRENLERYFFK